MHVTRRRNGARRTRHAANGQALAEFAIALPVLALLFLGILQFAFIFVAQLGLTNAAREAARYASITPTSTATDATTHGDAVMARLRNTILPTNVSAFQSGNLGTPTQVCYSVFMDASAVPVPAIQVRVQVTYNHPLFIPLVGSIIDAIDGTSDGAFSVGASEALRVDNPPLDTSPLGFPVCRP
jgi:Flp pilus assembly protein TadG